MASEQTFSTNDLRSRSIDFKRDHEHKSKWAHGTTLGPGRTPEAHVAPMKASFRAHSDSKAHVVRSFHRAKIARKQEIVDERAEYSYDAHYPPLGTSPGSSDEEAVMEPSAAPDADIVYSFDAKRSPSHGSQVLTMALEQAVERFQNTETDKIVQREYELLDEEGDAVPIPIKSKGKKPATMKERPIEDEYEFV